MKTAEEVKNQIAIQKGYPDWQTMENWIIDNNKPVVVAQLLVGAMDEAMEAYHQEKLKGGIRAKALRKKGTEEWYFFNGYDSYEWELDEIPIPFEGDIEDQKECGLPADAELIDIIILEETKP